jgi:hypothetical protein
MSQIHEGGCLCGAVRYRAKNEPVRRAVCHCRGCQRRTGSAFGIGAYFRDGDVELTGELYPGLRALAGGSFDDPDWLSIERHVWTRSKHKWFVCPPGAEVFEKGSLQQVKR